MSIHRSGEGGGGWVFLVLVLGVVGLAWMLAQHFKSGKPVAESSRRAPQPAVMEEGWDRGVAGGGAETDWLADLPRLEPLAPIADAGLNDSTPVLAEPVEVSLGDVEIPLPHAVWRLGRFNGLPRDRMSTVSGPEYGLISANGATHHVRSPDEFPQFVMPGQTLLLHVPPLPNDTYLLCMAVTGEKSKDLEFGHMLGEDLAASRARIRWNDAEVWHGWYAPLSHVIRAVIPSDALAAGDDILAIENMGEAAIPLDAVWIEPYRLGNPIHVSLEEGHWLGRDEAQWVRVVCLELPVPTWSESPAVLPVSRHEPPTRSADYAARWSGVSERLRRVVAMEGMAKAPLQEWWEKIREAALRDQLVEVRVSAGREGRPALDAAAYVFGDVVHLWQLPFHQQSGEDLAVQVRAQVPQARIVGGGRGRSGATEPFPAAPLGVRERLNWFGPRWVIEQASARRSFLDGETEAERWRRERHSILRIHPSPIAAKPRHGFEADLLTMSMAEYLMHSDWPLRLNSARPGSPLFPAGDGSPAPLWNAVKPMLAFGGAGHRKGWANVYPVVGDRALLNVQWALADNGEDSVHLLIRNPIFANDWRVRVQAPVSWEGPTRVREWRQQMAWADSIPEPEVAEEERYLARPLAGGEGSARGIVAFDLALGGLHVFELFPERQPPPRRNQRAPARVGFHEMTETRELFVQAREPLPIWVERHPAYNGHWTSWRAFGSTTAKADGESSRDGVTDWKPRQGLGRPELAVFSDVPPVRGQSARVRFNADASGAAQVARASLNAMALSRGDTLALWVRAHPIEGLPRDPRDFHGPPRARFAMGSGAYRQVMELEYGKWHLFFSPLSMWRSAPGRVGQELFLWPGTAGAASPEIEINAVEVFDSKAVAGETGSACFLTETTGGKGYLLLVGEAGKRGYVRQRLHRVINPQKLARVSDPALLVSADDPAARPPEQVECAVNYYSESRMLEMRIPQMPVPPSPEFSAIIDRHFPRVAAHLRGKAMAAVLFELDEAL